MSVNEKMTAIADAIRWKTGKTEEMTLDQMATEIGAIETGASLPGVSNITYGEFTPASDVSTITIEHGLGEKPHLVALWATGEKKPAQFSMSIFAQPKGSVSLQQSSYYNVALDNSGNTFYADSNYTSRGGISSADSTSFTVAEGQTVKYLTAGTTYCWLAIALDAVGGL